MLEDALCTVSQENNVLGNAGSRQRSTFIAWINEYGIREIDEKTYNTIATLPTPAFHVRADTLLRSIQEETKYIGHQVDIREPMWLTKTWSINYQELSFLIQYLNDVARIQINGNPRYDNIEQKGVGVIIQSEGWSRLEKLKEHNPDSEKAFVAMCFSDDLREVFFDGFYKGITEAGYRPVRIDLKEHINRIDDEIIAEIRSSKFVVADLTHHRGGVYFEAGFAAGKSMPVIWTCRKDHMDGTHFDVRQFNTIIWEEPEELRKRLKDRVVAVIGKGTYKGD